VGAAQQAQVLGDGRAGDGKGFGNLPGRLAAAAQEIEDGPACGIGQGLECGFRGSGFGASGLRPLQPEICNRTVTHNA
jgi:hypothetical protein